jgi:hypothetical protein
LSSTRQANHYCVHHVDSSAGEQANRVFERHTFYRSALLPLLRRINAYLMRWLRKKYKRLASKKKARACWERVTAQYPRLFAHWAWVPYSWWTG